MKHIPSRWPLRGAFIIFRKKGWELAAGPEAAGFLSNLLPKYAQNHSCKEARYSKVRQGMN